MRAVHWVLVLALAGCSSSTAALTPTRSAPRTTVVPTMTRDIRIVSTEESVSKIFQVPADPAMAWKVLPLVYEELGLPGAVEDEAGRLFGARNRRAPREILDERLSEYIDCGHGMAGPNADVYRVTIDLVTVIRPSETGIGSHVETKVDGQARPRDMGRGPVSCTSNGELERQIAVRVNALAGG